MSSSIPSARTRRRAILAAGTGTFIEFFDFTIYAVFASVIAAEFFPGQSGLTALLSTFAVFGVSYLFRPLGALVFGHWGDKLGRRNVLAVSILMMSTATFLMGLVPNHAAIGVLAPLLLIALRCIQGFSAGGEWGGATTFLAEYAPPGRRGLYTGMNMFSLFLGVLFGVVVGGAISVISDPAFLHDWGWRIPFVAALPVGAVGLYLRRKLDETPEFTEVKTSSEIEASPLAAALAEHRRALFIVIGLTIMATSGTYMLLFMPTYLTQIQGLSFTSSLVATAGSFALSAVAILASAIASDRYGRKPFLILSSGLSILFAVPCFMLIDSGTGGIVVGLSGVSLIVGILAGAFPAAIAEAFPANVRFSGLSLGYGVATSVFGGTTPLILTWLLKETGSATAPAYFFAATGVVTLAAALSIQSEAGTARSTALRRFPA